MDKTLERIISTPMSNKEIQQYIPVMTYDEFFYNDEQLPCVILYEQYPGYGHWCMVHESIDEDNNKCYEFFDSYGLKPDQAWKILNKNVPKKMVNFLLNSNKKISYSDVKLQGSDEKIMTCGRHCIVRYLFRNYCCEDYAKGLIKLSKELNTTPDHIVSLIIN